LKVHSSGAEVGTFYLKFPLWGLGGYENTQFNAYHKGNYCY
jgi:hypothetical protein